MSSSVAPGMVLAVVVVVVVVVVVIVMMVVVVMVTSVSGGLFLASLINGRALSDAVVVALPYDVGVDREAQQAFDGFPAWQVSPWS